MLHLPDYSRIAISLLAAVDPVAAVPIFLSQTRGLTAKETSRTATMATCTAAFVLLAAALTGQTILPMLGTSLGSLQIAGGLVMLVMAFPQLKSSHVHDGPRIEQGSATGVVPIGFPLLAGPVSISTVIVAMRQGTGTQHTAVVISSVLATCATAWIVLRGAQSIEAHIGQRGLNALNRVFALLIASIAVEIISAGIRSLFPMLG
jgi:multiple antibiotic resistance protein